jgi:endo-1,4-beta-xylanase
VSGCLAALPYLDTVVVGATPLRKRAEARGVLFGTEVGHKQFRDQHYTRVLKDDFGILVTGNELKWGSLEWREGVLNFSRPDKILAFADANGMAFRGHTLVWHMQTPPWLETVLTDADWRPRDILLALSRSAISPRPGLVD